MQCLADSGSTITLLGTKAFRRIDPAQRPKKIGGPSTAKTANGKLLYMDGFYKATISILGRTQEIVLAVAPQLNGDFILGMDVMRDIGLIIDTEENACYYKHREGARRHSTAALVTRNKTVLEPRKATKIKFGTRTQEGCKMESCTGVAAIITKHPGLGNDEALVRTDKHGNVVAYISNLSNEPIEIPRGVVVGRMDKVTSKHPDGCLDEILENLPTQTPPQKMKCTAEKEEYIRANADLGHLSPQEQEQFIELLLKNADVISSNEFDLGNCQTLKHKLHLKHHRPIYVKQFPLPAAHYEEVNRFVDNWLKLGIIKPTYSEYNSPLFLVPKKAPDGKQVWRPVIDLRSINEACYPSNYRLNSLDETLQNIGRSQAKFYCSLDLTSGFHQISLTPSSQKYTAFTVPGRGTFAFVRACFGLMNLPLSFMRLMNIVFRNFKPDSHTIFIDDCLLMCRSMPDCLDTCQQAFDRLRAHDLKLNLKKCSWKKERLEYLGVEITPEGWRNGEKKTEAIRQSKPPENVKQIRSWLGLCGFFRNCIPAYAQLAGKLSDLTKKDSKWTGGKLPTEALKAFETLKKLLCERPVMAFPKAEGEFSLFTDASLDGVGAILLQKQEDEKGNKTDRVIAYASKALEKHQKAYTPFLLEMHGMCWGMEHFRQYLLGRHFKIYCDHKPAEKLTKVHTRTLHRLQELLLEYNFEVVYHKGEQQIADYLSRPERMCDRNIVAALQIDTSPILFDMPSSTLKNLQNEDKVTQTLITYLKSRTLPKSPELKKIITRYGKACYLKDDILFINLKRKNLLSKPCIFAPSMLHAEIIANSHGKFTTGHGGINNTKERVLTEFFWPNVDKDVEEFVKACPNCQLADKSKESTRKHGPLGTTPSSDSPLEIMHCDLFGPLRTDEGKSHILVMTDPFSKYTRFAAISNRKPETVAEAIMEHWVSDFGTPNICISDAAPDFCSKLSQEMWNLLGVDKRKTTPRHPQCNASAEIRNKHIIKYLKTMLEDDRILEWTKLLPMMQLSLNSSHNRAIRMSPFFCLYGVHPRTPFSDPNEPDKLFYGEDFITEMKVRLEKARQLAKQNNIVYRSKYSEEHDKGVKKYFKLQVGDLCLLHRPELPKINPKISNEWEGIYTVIAVVGLQNVLIQHLETKKTRYVNVSRVKPYISTPHFTTKDATAGKDAKLQGQDETSNKSDTAQKKSEDSGVTVDLNPDIVWLSPQEDIDRHRPIHIKTEEEVEEEREERRRQEERRREEEEEERRRQEEIESEPETTSSSKKTPIKSALGKVASKIRDTYKEGERRADDFFEPFRPGGQKPVTLKYLSREEYERQYNDPLKRRKLGRLVLDEEGNMLGVEPNTPAMEPLIVSREEFDTWPRRELEKSRPTSPLARFASTGARPKTKQPEAGGTGSSRLTRKGAQEGGVSLPPASAPPRQPPENKPRPGRPKKKS